MVLSVGGFDPSNLTHSIACPSIINEWVYDKNFRTAYFSILVHYYEILRDKYNNDLHKIPKTEIDKETTEYFNSIDTLTQFISERIINEYNTDGTEVPLVPIQDIMREYMKWHSIKIKPDNVLNHQELKHHIITHYRLDKYFKTCDSGEYLQFHKLLNTKEIFTESPIKKVDSTTANDLQKSMLVQVCDIIMEQNTQAKVSSLLVLQDLILQLHRHLNNNTI